MIETLFIIGILAALCILIFRDKGFTPPKTAVSDAKTYAAFERADSLFVNRSELAFFHSLHRALPGEYHLHSKVRLEDIVRVKRAITGQARWYLRGRVKSRHVDYLITDGQGVPKAAIELDGSSHNKAAANADALKNGIFSFVGIPLIRVRTGEDFEGAVHEILARLIGPEPKQILTSH